MYTHVFDNAIIFKFLERCIPIKPTDDQGCKVLTVVNCPHDPEGGPPDLIERLPAGDHLPQNDAPAEHVALLTVVTACTHTKKTHFIVTLGFYN